MHNPYKFILTIFVFCLISVGCENENHNAFYARVDFRVNIDALDYDLNGALNTKTFTSRRPGSPHVGLGGLLVVRSPLLRDGYTNLLDLYAYDLACPHEANANIRVTPDKNGKAKCEKCGSVFNIIGSGNVESGPSKNRLVSYPVYYRPNEQGLVFHILSNY